MRPLFPLWPSLSFCAGSSRLPRGEMEDSSVLSKSHGSFIPSMSLSVSLQRISGILSRDQKRRRRDYSLLCGIVLLC